MRTQTILSEGAVFGRLRVEQYVGNNSHSCMCECGAQRIVRTYKLLAGHTQSCGCLRWSASDEPAKKAHGLSKTRVYGIWRLMLARCSKPTCKDYPNYGGRGIRVCDRWHSLELFFADMGECPPGHSIDREDVDGNYEPTNCRWIPKPQQASTRRSAKRKQKATPEIVRLRLAGESQEQIARQVGVDQTTVSRVLAAGGMPSRVNSGRSWRPV